MDGGQVLIAFKFKKTGLVVGSISKRLAQVSDKAICLKDKYLFIFQTTTVFNKNMNFQLGSIVKSRNLSKTIVILIYFWISFHILVKCKSEGFIPTNGGHF